MPGGEKCNKNSINWKANGRKRGQFDSVLHAITFHPTSRPVHVYLVLILVCPKKISMSPSNGEQCHARDGTASTTAFFNNNENFHNKYSNA